MINETRHYQPDPLLAPTAMNILHVDVLAMDFRTLGLLGAGGDLVDLKDQFVAVDGVLSVVHLADIGGAQDVQCLADDGGVSGFGLFGVDVAVNHDGSLLIWLYGCLDLLLCNRLHFLRFLDYTLLNGFSIRIFDNNFNFTLCRCANFCKKL